MDKKKVVSKIVLICFSISLFFAESLSSSEITNSTDSELQEIINDSSYTPDTREAAEDEWNARQTSNQLSRAEEALIRAGELLTNANERMSKTSAISSMSAADLTQLSNNVRQCQKAVETAREKLESITAGDPVLVTSGKYEHSEIDLSFKKTIHLVTRRYISDENNGYSFGKEWATNLDSRIIRGITPVNEQDLNELKDLSDYMNASYTESLQLVADNPECNTISGTLYAYFLERNNHYLEVKKIRDRSIALSLTNTFSIHNGIKNKLTTTGNETLIYIDENANPIIFQYIENGEWIPKDPTRALYMKIKSLDGNGAETNSGFIVEERGRNKKYFDGYGLLSKIETTTEHITIKRNSDSKQIEQLIVSNGITYTISYINNKLKRIFSDITKEEIIYNYDSNERLTSVIDIDGDSINYVYKENLLHKIVKSDGSISELTYGLEDQFGIKKITETVNEVGSSEYFVYFTGERKVVHTNPSGIETQYWYDDNQKIIREKILDIVDIFYEYDSQTGLLTGRRKNDIKENYFYDKRGNRERIWYQDNSNEVFTYNEKDELMLYIDRDGIETRFEYDANGNITKKLIGEEPIFTARYNEKNLLIEFKNGLMPIKKYYYDSFNYLASTEQFINGEIYEEKYIHDKRGRLLLYINPLGQKTMYTYENKKIISVTPTLLKTTIIMNGRKDIVSIHEEDLRTGEKREKKIEYDNRHLPIKLTEGDGSIHEFTYREDGLIIEKISGKWHETRSYDEAGRLHQIKKNIHNNDDCFIEQYTYSNTYYGEHVELFAGNSNQLWLRSTSIVDVSQQRTQKINAVGEKQIFQYSSGGKLLKTINSLGGIIEYSYSRNGILKQYGKENKMKNVLTYINHGYLSQSTNTLGDTQTFLYDDIFQIKTKEIPQGKFTYSYDKIGRIKQMFYFEHNDVLIYEVQYEYDDENRVVIKTEGNSLVTKYFFDAWGKTIRITNGENNDQKIEYDKQGRLIAKIDGNGYRTSFQWNEINLISSIRYPNSSSEHFYYDHNHNLLSIEDDRGYAWKGTYDERGRLSEEFVRPGFKRMYFYDEADRIIKITSGNKTVASYRYDNNGKQLTCIDGKEKYYSYDKDDFGRLIQETNRNGHSALYYYDDEDILIKKKKFDGSEINYSIDSKNGIHQTDYKDTKNIIFTKNGLGAITSAESETGLITFLYSSAGLLTRQYDSGADEVTEYEYDKAGRRILMKSGNRCIHYTWGKNDELLSIFDENANMSIKFEYNALYKETKRIFQNGVIQYTHYNSVGDIIAIREVDARDMILRAEGYVYDSEGRRILIIDEKASVTKIKYDAQGFVSETHYPYSEIISQKDKEEAINAGLFITEGTYTKNYTDLTQGEVTSLERLLAIFGNNPVFLPQQLVYSVHYSYDLNGNRSSKTTHWGTLPYSYDSENRLQSIADIRFTYDAEGNVLSEKSLRKEAIYTYTASNRMKSAEITDTLHNTHHSISFSYDSFGRRTLRNQGDLGMRTLYDGLSFDIIRDEATYSDNTFISSSVPIRNTPNTSNQHTSSRYRFLDSETLQQKDSESSNRFRAYSHPLFVNGKIASISDIYLENSDTIHTSYRTRYFGFDILSSVRSATIENGTVSEKYSYDAFGTPIEGDFSNNGAVLAYPTPGYTGKPYDSITKTYDYGYRDYMPHLARFTSVDPVKDGLNWFNYANNDPVNYVDLWGLLNVALDKVDMHDSSWGNEKLGNSSTVLVNEQGCYAAGFSSAATKLTGKTVTPSTLNKERSTNFAKDSQSMLPKAASEKLELVQDYWTKDKQGNLGSKINELNNSAKDYGVLAQVPYNKEGDLHWVGVNGGTVTEKGIEYITATGTSKNDYSKDIRPKDWKIEGDTILIPTSDIVQIHTFTEKKNK